MIAVLRLAEEEPSGRRRQQRLEVHVEPRTLGSHRRVADHVPVRVVLEQHEVAAGLLNAIDQRGIELADVRHVRHRRVGHGHEHRDDGNNRQPAEAATGRVAAMKPASAGATSTGSK